MDLVRSKAAAAADVGLITLIRNPGFKVLVTDRRKVAQDSMLIGLVTETSQFG